jgi:hypothetical protein
MHGLKEFNECPDVFEGVVVLDSIAHFVICGLRKDGSGIADVYVIPRKLAEEVLNRDGLSTIEPWSPWPERTH